MSKVDAALMKQALSEVPALTRRVNQEWQYLSGLLPMEGEVSTLTPERFKKLRQFVTQVESILKNWDTVGDRLRSSDTKALKYVENLKALLTKIEEYEIFPPDNDHDFYLTISAGSGGKDAQEWAAKVLHMYRKYLEGQGWQAEDKFLEKTIVGIRAATLRVSGRSAYTCLKSEDGIHRVTRVSQFGTGARHTSFADVAVVKEISREDIEVPLHQNDVVMTTMKSSGPGGQAVNKRETAVRLVHTPSGINVECSAEASQLRNKEIAMGMLTTQVQAWNDERFEEQILAIRGVRSIPTFGSEVVRSYKLSQQRVYDHRTRSETTRVQHIVRDGHLEDFIIPYLKFRRQELLRENTSGSAPQKNTGPSGPPGKKSTKKDKKGKKKG